MARLIGYARTSTVDQDAGLEEQHRNLAAARCDRIYSEKVSSMVVRKQLDLAIEDLQPGDALMVTKPDRLARSTIQLLTIEADLAKRGCGLVVLSMQLDTRKGVSSTGKLMLHVLAAVAEFERAVMLERQKVGIAKARADGTKFGRRPTARLSADSVIRLRSEGLQQTEIAARCNISLKSVSRIVSSHEWQKPADFMTSC